MIDKGNPYYYYYSKNNTTYLSKFDVVKSEPDVFSKTRIFFHIPNIEKSFSEMNLYEEPIEDLQKLYLDRAIQIRNNYDYVVLFYSGGADSHCILETFMLNNIFLDEIVVFDMFDTTTKKQIEIEDNEKFLYLNAEGRGYEIEKSAIPLAKYFVENFSPRTKITYFPKMQEEHLRFWNNFSKNSFYENLDSNVTELILNRPVFRIRDTNVFNPDWKKLKQNKKVVHLWGREKPAIRYDDHGFYFFFNDALFHSTFDNKYDLTIDGLPTYNEYFHIHPSSAKLFLKQAHMLVNKLPKSFFYEDKKKILDTRYYQDKVSDIIYNFKVKLPYQGLKPEDLFFGYKNNPNNYPNFKKIVEHAGIGAIRAWPSIMKFFIDNKNLTAIENHDNFKKFIYDNFFIQTKNKSFNVFNDLTTLCITNKFYFKKC